MTTRTARALLPIGAIVPLLLACATAQDDFDRAARADSVAAYEAFLRKNPRSEFDARARERIQALHDKARADRERQALLELQAWQAVEREPTITALQDFIARFPKAERLKPAQDRLRRLFVAEALARAGGQRSAIKPGKTFPIELFREDDFIAPLQPMTVNYLARYGGAAVRGFSLAHQRLVGGAGIDSLVTRLVWERGVPRPEVGIELALRPERAATQLTSGTHRGVALRLFQDPDRERGPSLRVWITRTYRNGARIGSEFGLAGVGLALLQRNGATEVYEFVEPTRSMLGEP